ncbi:uncharacterized protein LOC111387543 isoform X1 [Olea europaea var. sylvestris]|uniref:uncharacterized protein LOC111387543 isoform X1 n=1 Tax=Olea europaea var. sylvestris TaxID=158386 RepID=UPI000C1D7D08|nr:uncharacterized protein LOC111387543 isoform X1 [Olea europaea var. sylvestris]
MFSELLGYIGDTWDPNTNNVNATEEVWQHFYTINKSDYKLFKREGCKHYHALGEIFSGKRDWISTHKEGSMTGQSNVDDNVSIDDSIDEDSSDDDLLYMDILTQILVI